MHTATLKVLCTTINMLVNLVRCFAVRKCLNVLKCCTASKTIH